FKHVSETIFFHHTFIGYGFLFYSNHRTVCQFFVKTSRNSRLYYQVGAADTQMAAKLVSRSCQSHPGNEDINRQVEVEHLRCFSVIGEKRPDFLCSGSDEEAVHLSKIRSGD